MNPSTLMWGVVFGAIGMGFFVYGKKQKVIAPLDRRHWADVDSLFYIDYNRPCCYRYHFNGPFISHQTIGVGLSKEKH